MTVKTIWRAWVVLALVVSALTPAVRAGLAQDAPRFVSVIDDLPLMNGLSEVGEGVEFATPQGRLVEATASGPLSREAVMSFYVKTLPQLGWSQAGDARFVREGETLDLVFSADGGVLSVRFSLAPSLAPTDK